jgi:hypothetical protein
VVTLLPEMTIDFVPIHNRQGAHGARKCRVVGPEDRSAIMLGGITLFALVEVTRQEATEWFPKKHGLGP